MKYFEFDSDTKFAKIYSPFDETLIWSGECADFSEACELKDAFQQMFRHGRASAFQEVINHLDAATQRFKKSMAREGIDL